MHFPCVRRDTSWTFLLLISHDARSLLISHQKLTTGVAFRQRQSTTLFVSTTDLLVDWPASSRCRGCTRSSTNVHTRWSLIDECTTCMLNHCMEWYKWVLTKLHVYPTDSGLTHLLHDLSPDGGTHPTILFCKLLAVTRETNVTLIHCLHDTAGCQTGCITGLTTGWRFDNRLDVCLHDIAGCQTANRF